MCSKRSRFPNAIMIALLAMLVSGCANWKDSNQLENSEPLPVLNESPRSLLVEVEFIPIDVEGVTSEDMQSLWQWVDETIVENEKRGVLVSNGLKVGKLIREDRFRERLEGMTINRSAVDQFLFSADIASEVAHGVQRVPMRFGKRYELPVRQPIEGTHVAMVSLDGKLEGRTLQDPQFLFAVTPTTGARPQEVAFRLRPEVQHGLMRQKWVSSDAALRIDHRRDTWAIKQLDIELSGVEHDVFVIGSDLPSRGLGKQMFAGKSNDQTEQRVILVLKLSKVPTPAERL